MVRVETKNGRVFEVGGYSKTYNKILSIIEEWDYIVLGKNNKEVKLPCKHITKVELIEG